MSDKNLLCIVLTFGLAFFAIGNSFRSGNYILGFESLFIWLIVYSIMPLASIIDRKMEYKYANIDLAGILYKTVQNNYLFVSFCIALLLSILFDDLVDFTGHFVQEYAGFDVPVISLLVAFSAVFSLSFYYLFSKRKIENLKRNGIKVDAKVESIKNVNGTNYVKAIALNPLTNEKVVLVSRIYTFSLVNIPETLPVYFDVKDALEYFFDANIEKD